MATVSKLTRGAVAGNGWTSAANATADDGVYATATPAKNGTTTGDWDFAAFSDAELPAGSTINSVTVEVQWKVSTTASVDTLGVAGVNGSSAGTETTTTTATTADSVATASLSGVTESDLKTAGQIKGRVRASRGNTNTAFTASLDYVKVTVDYTLVPSTGLTDAFGRTTSSSWGPPDSGNAGQDYTLGGAFSASFCNGSKGVQKPATAGTTISAYALNVAAGSLVFLARVQTDKLAVGDKIYAMQAMRLQDTANYIRTVIAFATDQTIDLTAYEVIANVSNALSGPGGTIVQLPRETHAANQDYWFETRCTGSSPTTLEIRFWRDGTSRPSAPDATFTSSTAQFQGTGGVGFKTFLAASASNAPVQVLWDDASVAPLVSGSGSVSIPGPSLSASAFERFAASGGITAPAPSFSASGFERFTGSGDVSMPGPTLSGTGTAGGAGVTGSGGVSLPGPTLAGSAFERFVAVGGVSVPGPMVGGSGFERISGSGAAAIPGPSVSGSGYLRLTAAGGVTFPGPSLGGEGGLVVAPVTGSGGVSFGFYLHGAGEAYTPAQMRMAKDRLRRFFFGKRRF